MKIMLGLFLAMVAIGLAIPGDNGTGEAYPTLALFAFIGAAWALGTATSDDEDGYWKIMAWPLAIGVLMGAYEAGASIINWLIE